MWYNIDRKKEVVQAMVEYYVTVEWEGEGQKLEEALNRASALGGAAIYMNELDCVRCSVIETGEKWERNILCYDREGI